MRRGVLENARFLCYNNAKSGSALRCEADRKRLYAGKENGMKKKGFSLLAAAVTALASLPFGALPAAAEEKPVNARCGDELIWSYDESTAVLTVTGSGMMFDFQYGTEAPWSAYKDQIETVVLPDGLLSVGNNAFSECGALRSVSLPDSVEYLGAFAFSDCWKLESVSLPAGLTEIGHEAFCNCESLTEITLPEHLTGLGSGAFSACCGLTEVTIPESLTVIPDYAFNSCISLKSVTLHAGITAIGEAAFNCTQLETVSFPSSLTDIGRWAFDYTPWMDAAREMDPQVTVNGVLIDAKLCTGIVTVRDGVSVIGPGAFSGSGDVREVIIPGNVTRIAEDAFSCCYALQAVTIPESVTEIGARAFSYCNALTAVVIPDSITVLEESVFDGCYCLEHVTLPDCLAEIKNCAFANCRNVKSISIRNVFCVIAPENDTLPPYAVIFGYSGSFAEHYAYTAGRQFRELSDADPPEKYTFEIIPLLDGFNQFFLVKTTYPDPQAFRFIDRSSSYTFGHALIRYTQTRFADVDYDDPETLRVSGGYIFESFETDGGEVSLQYNIALDGTEAEWYDCGMPIELPKLCDDTDYLISTYAKSDDFFERMDAVQKGFSSVCLYSGCDIRGELIRTSEYWRVSRAMHSDQLYYIYSPYERRNNCALLATFLYPFRFDSVGFPEKMGMVARRMNLNAKWKWSNNNHSRIAVTYEGISKTYGGQGSTEGQGITEELLTHRFTLDDDDLAGISLESLLRLQKQYAAAAMPDDIPRGDALTWSGIAETVGYRGAWAQIGGFTYFYKADDRGYEACDAFGAGNSVYFGGSLGYYQDTWIDGRYIDSRQMWEQGAVLADHPDADIVCFDVTLPVLDGQKQLARTITADVRYHRNAAGGWTAEDSVFSAIGASLGELRELAQEGQLDEGYLSALELTPEAAEALGVDRNTNEAPAHYYIYDGSARPGTEVSGAENVLRGDTDCSGTVNIADAVMLARFLAEDSEITVTAEGKRNAELDGKAGLTADDSAVLLQMLANLR